MGTSLRVSRPPADSVEVRSWVLDSFRELRLLRTSLHEALTGEPMPDGGVLDQIPEKMALVATELAANALAHTRPPTRVRLCRTEHSFILDVADHDPALVPRLADQRRARTGGRGLHITRKLAIDLGWYVDGEIKHEWAQFAIPRPVADPA